MRETNVIRLAHRLLIVVLTLLTIGTGALVIVSYNRPMGFGVLEPTWFSRTVDVYPSRWASAYTSLGRGGGPSDYRVFTYVGVWGGQVRTFRQEGAFQRPPTEFARQVFLFKSKSAEWWVTSFHHYQRRWIYSGRPDTTWPLVRFYPDRTGFGWVCSLLEVSICLPLALFSVYPVIAFIRFVPGPIRRRRRRRRGLCVRCGYDLTGNQSGTCPECGEAA